ncbi:hypothetical protein YC2023_018373 [Brassica napus]
MPVNVSYSSRSIVATSPIVFFNDVFSGVSEEKMRNHLFPKVINVGMISASKNKDLSSSFDFSFFLLSVISIPPHLLSKFRIFRSPLLAFYMHDQSGLMGLLCKGTKLNLS